MNTTNPIQDFSKSVSIFLPERLHSSFIEDRLQARQFEECTTSVLAQHWYGPGYSVCSMQTTLIPCDSLALTSPCPLATQARPSTATTTQSSSQSAAPASSGSHNGISDSSKWDVVIGGIVGACLLCYGIWVWAKIAQRKSQRRQSSKGSSVPSASTSGPPGDPPMAGHKSNASSSTTTSSLNTTGANAGSIELQDRQPNISDWVHKQQRPEHQPPPWYVPRWLQNLSSLSSSSSSRSDHDQRGKQKSSDVRSKGTKLDIVNSPPATLAQKTPQAPSKEEVNDKGKDKLEEKSKEKPEEKSTGRTTDKSKDRSKGKWQKSDQQSHPGHWREMFESQTDGQQRPEKQQRVPYQYQRKSVIAIDKNRPQKAQWSMPGAYLSTSTSDTGNNGHVSHEDWDQGPFMSGALQSSSPPPSHPPPVPQPPTAAKQKPSAQLYHPERAAKGDRQARNQGLAPSPVQQQKQHAGGKRGSKQNSVPLPVWEEEKEVSAQEPRAGGQRAAPAAPPPPPPPPPPPRRSHLLGPFNVADDPIDRPAAPPPPSKSQTHQRRDSVDEQLYRRDLFRDRGDEENAIGETAAEQRIGRRDERRNERREERRNSHRQVKFWGVLEEGSD